jgi:hypothetical protein
VKPERNRGEDDVESEVMAEVPDAPRVRGGGVPAVGGAQARDVPAYGGGGGGSGFDLARPDRRKGFSMAGGSTSESHV